ncbi:hypothetical protein F5Y11DRAFT_343414 [Daldinia sp. FL1419]|nr:hypothetical protein F5Y11DRAFT_343414 [Daldinia sp. FL1419]
MSLLIGMRRRRKLVGYGSRHSLGASVRGLPLNSAGSKQVGQEAGVTVFLTRVNHIDLGAVLLPGPSNTTCAPRRKRDEAKTQLALRFRAEGTGTPPEPRIVVVSEDWLDGPIRLHVETASATHYNHNLAAAPAAHPDTKILVGTASAGLISGGNGSFVGSLVGAYATCNGAGVRVKCPEGGEAYLSRWRYTGVGQYISETEVVYIQYVNS